MGRLVFEAVIRRQGILRVVDVPDEFAEQVVDWDFPPAIARVGGVEGGLEVVELLPPGLRRQMLVFLEEAKSPQTRRKRLSRVRELLEKRTAGRR